MTASISTPSRLMSSAFPAALSAFAVGAAAQTGWLAPDSGVAGVLAASVAVGALAAFGRAMFRRAPVNAADEPAAAAARHDVSRRLRALEMSSTLTMLADRDLRIVYLNEALRRMLAEAQSDIRKDLPNFDASALIGACIDVFHVRAEHQRRMIEALKTRHDAEISLGGRFFTLAVSPVLDEAGERIATVVEWRDVTVENRVMRSIDAVVNAANDGEFGARVDAAGATGLLAEMAGKVNRLAETVDVGLGETRRVLGAVAEGDLTQRMQGDFRGAFAALQSSLNTAATKLQSAFAEMKGASSDLETGASGIRDNAEKLAQRTELQATSLEESSASLEQMAVTIKANAENAVRATELSNAASSRAQARTAVVQETVSAMTRIEQSATRIADIIGVIDGIAFQTNLLALNAAVEAARAGEAGKGFAIVASEVRTLAQRSADAANDIRGLIENSSTHVADGVRLVEQTGDALAEIVASFQEVSSAIAEITEAGREQASGVEEVSAAILQMDQTTQQNAEMADASVNASRGLEATASRLSSAMAAFRIADGRQASSQQPAPRRAAEDRRDREWQAVEKTAPAAAVKAAPVKAASANAASVKSAPAKDASATRASAKAAPARERGAKEVPAKEVMAKEVLAKEAPAKAAGAGAAAGGDWAEF